MWTTQDGYRLQPPSGGLGRLAAQLRRPGLWPLVQRHYRGSMVEATARTVEQLARTARRVGAVRHGPTGQRYPVFAAPHLGRRVYLVTRPLTARSHAIVALLPEASPSDSGGEYMVRGGEVTVHWSEPMPLEQAAQMKGGGVYILERGGEQIYVGEGGQFGGKDGRLAKRAEYARQHRDTGLMVRVGTIQNTPTGPKGHPLRDMAESTLILDLNRYNQSQGRDSLTNKLTQPESQPYDSRGVVIHHAGAVPPHLQHLPRDKQGGVTERIPRGVHYSGMEPPPSPQAAGLQARAVGPAAPAQRPPTRPGSAQRPPTRPAPAPRPPAPPRGRQPAAAPAVASNGSRPGRGGRATPPARGSAGRGGGPGRPPRRRP